MTVIPTNININLLNDAINDTPELLYNKSNNTYIDNNNKINIFYDMKQELLDILQYKQYKLYNYLTKMSDILDKYKIIEYNNDIYNFHKYYNKNINNISFKDCFYRNFNDIYKNILYDYTSIKKHIKFIV